MRRTALLLLLLATRALAAQEPDVSHADDFQSYAAQAMPVGWAGPFTTAPDPLDAKNMVFGTSDAPAAGAFATLTTAQFGSRFELRGRMLRTDAEARVGVAFFSELPERDAYYLIALDDSGGKRRSVRSQAAGMTMRLEAHGGGAPAGTLDSGFTPEPNRWYDFAIAADAFDNATHLRARFWPSGTPEPATWQIEGRDTALRRLDAGRIGLWSAVRGGVWFDDLSAKSWSADQAPPRIQFFDAEGGAELDPGRLAVFRKPARIDVRGADSVKLGDADYGGAPISADGFHALTASAGFVTATLRLLVDQRPPELALLADGAPLVDGHVFARDVVLDARVTDVSNVTITSTVGALPMPLAAETQHSVTVTAIDQAGWESTATATFTIDKTPPQITILGNGVPFLAGHTFNQDVTLTWSATDATLDSVTATLDGATIQPGAIVSAAAAHALVVTATDRAGHTTRLARDFVLRKGAPDVRLLANGAALEEKTYGTGIAITADIVDPTPVTHVATLDGSRYTLGDPIGAGLHRFSITVTNAAGIETTIGPVAFTVDLAAPVLTLDESNAPFTDGMKFNRDVLPQLAARDDFTASPKITLMLDGREYPPNAAIAEERAEHVITATAVDDAGHTATIGPFRFLLDKTRPVVTILEPAADALLAKPVQVKVEVEDLTATTVAATLGGTPVDITRPIALDGTHRLSVIATDAVGWESAAVTATFTIDTAAPAIRFDTPAADSVVTAPAIELLGFADDAVSITVNGVAAQLDTVNKQFAVRVPLLEGRNELTAVAVDKAGNRGSARHPVQLDTRAPELAVTAPAANACLDAESIEVRGTVGEAATVRVNGVTATVVNGTFTATVPLGNEGRFVIAVEALDAAGHVAALNVPIVVDRTPPIIEILEGGQPFTATLLNRPVALFARVAGGSATMTLDGQPYTGGSVIADDRLHELRVVATDCAGHTAARTVAFEIDRTAPAILTFMPQSGSILGTKPQITGTTSPDAVSVAAGGATHPVTAGAFAIADPPLVNGANELRLTVTDRAGNSAEQTYALTLDLLAPAVEIVESGAPIPPNALFAREVRPVIRASEGDATITATLNGSAFVSGTPVSATGSYTLTATATDARGHTSPAATATFTIDRSAPAIDILAPADGANVGEDRVEVRGTVAGGDVQAVTVNGIAAPLVSGAFAILVPLDFGPNALIATAVDRAGNTASDAVEVTRGGAPAGIVLTAPSDGAITNRRTTVVSGQLLTVTPTASVTINGVEVPVDPGGFFRKTDFALAEGENVITAAVTGESGTNQVSVRVTADLTPPRLRILESGQPLAEGARFAERAVIAVESSDGAPQLLVDSDVATAPVTIEETGGHTLVATARDAAGNESRVERTIFIGAAGTATCRLEGFDPVHGAVVTGSTVTISGRSGGAAGVKVNGTPALVANGSFCATVELPAEGDNAVTLACTDAGGNATGDPQTLVLRRATSDPTVAIDLPAEGAVLTTETVAVSGSANGGVTVEVNGALTTFVNSSWSAPSIRLSPGLNVLVARARAASGRTTAVSRRVLYLKDAPAVTITAPAAALTTGAASIDLSGGWSDLDPSAIRINGLAATVKTFSDTTGTWSADVPLQPGQNTLTVTGHDDAGRTASASLTVTRTAGFPSVSITEPADNAVFGAASPETFTVRGTFTAAAGSTVDVSGEPALIDGGTFTATVRHAAGRITPVVVRVTTPDGVTAVDTVRVTRLAARPTVLEHFPAADAVQVDAAAMPLVLFSAPMDLVSTAAAFRLENAAGAPLSGTLRLDRDVLTFAPSALLTPGERYTVRVADSAKSIAGDTIETTLATSFTIAAGAGTQAPTLGPVAAGCAQTVALTGTAPANARLRIDHGALSFTTTATAAGAWSFQLPLGGASGYQVVRVRIAGSDGSLSPAAESCFLVDCAAPRAVSASYDRAANRITVTFTKPVSLTSDAVVLRLADNRLIGATVSTSGSIATITPAEDLTAKTFTIELTAFAFTETFVFDPDAPPPAGDGSGFMSGEVFDAESGRPLAAASVWVDVAPAPLVTDARGRYAARLPEGAHTLRVSASGYTTVWRQIVIPPGAGVIPIDIRLTPEAAPGPIAQATVDHTLVDAQSLPGLLPLGWSPLAAAVARNTGTLEFTVPAADVAAASQVLTVVRYHDDRDEWRVLTAAASIVSGKVTVPIDAPGAYALVYPDAAPHLQKPPAPTSGAVLTGVTDPCTRQPGNAATPEPCPPLESHSFTLDPPLVLPTGRTVATLTIKGAAPHAFPSGTAVQAYIDEELRLADGTRVTDPPFTTDLLLYRNLSGTLGVAEFKLGPSPRAAQVILDVGFSNIRILPYPGRLDRGTLVGPEGGRVPGDGQVTVEIPAGATIEPLRATTAAIDDLDAFGTIPGFTIAGGFTLSLQLARAVTQPEGLLAGAPELLRSARVTFPNAGSGQHILVEVLDGPRFRLAAQMEAIAGGRATTKSIDRATLPLDGVIRDGRYLLLRADAPIAFATGLLRNADDRYLRDAGVAAPPLGVTDRTRVAGTYAVPVPAAPGPPFRLVPSTPVTGNGAAYTHASSPAADTVVRVDLTLQAEPPRLIATEPAGDANNVALTAFVKAHFDRDLDAVSITSSSITVVDAATQTPVTADVLLESPRTVLWRLRGGENRLTPDRTYSVLVSPAIRGANGSPSGRTHAFKFTTVAQLTSGGIHPDKIRITIPDANGHSRILGAAGALPAGYIAVATRRIRDFATPFQAAAAADGSFTIAITERVELTDDIDLQVLNAARSIAAVLPLTPFVTEDLRGFVARPDRETKFLSPEGIAVTVPAGAFDTPTVVTVSNTQQTAFAAVPNFASELTFAAAVTLQFDGIARERLEIELPIPQGTDTAKPHVLGYLGQSIRGPRVMVVDLLRVDGGRFTTIPAPASPQKISTQAVLTGADARSFLLGANRAGTYSALSFTEPMAWAFVQGVSAAHELFFDTMQSIFAASYYMAERGSVLVPVRAGRPFTITGVSATADVTLFNRTYDALGAGDPGASTVLPSPIDNVLGPYPVLTSPARVEIFDLGQTSFTDESARNFVLAFDGSTATLTSSVQRVPPDTRVELLNLGTSSRVSANDFAADADGLSLTARKGDRLLLFVEERFVDPSSAITVVFNKPIEVASEAALRELFTLSVVESDGEARPITAEARISAESGNRRFVITLPSSLQRGRTYRLTLSKDIRDDVSESLKLAQRRGQAALADGIHFDFATRAPQGLVHSFELAEGGVRDLAMSGNILFVSALEAGLLAYDASNPAALETPFAKAEPPIAGQNWAVAADHHGRVFATAVSDMFGVLRTYRTEDFVGAGGPVTQKANAIVSWRPGVNVGLPLSTSAITVSDRPEAIPRKVRVVAQDAEPLEYASLDELVAAYPSAQPVDVGNGFRKVELSIPARDGFAYLVQRVTVLNQSARFRWSVDVPRGGVGKVTVIGRPGDRFQLLRNLTTYAVISLFGYGVGIFDVNAVESNRLGAQPPLSERVLITKGEVNPPCDPRARPAAACDAEAAAALGTHCPIEDLTLSPEAELGAASNTELIAWALDARRGLVELRVSPPRDNLDGTVAPVTCDRANSIILADRFMTAGGFRSFAHPRLNTLRRLYRERFGREPVARFTSIAGFTRGGVRYGLVAGFEYGLPVVRLDANAPLNDHSLVDVIWIPDGAWSVRVLEGESLATVVDGRGRVLLVDLAKVDESDEVPFEPLCLNSECEWQLFPTARAALTSGADDPRIVWKSEEGLVTGTLPPLVDPETGFVFTGDVGGRTLRVVSAVDPRLRLIAEPRGLPEVELQSVVPHGVARPARAPESLGAFRIEVTLPGSVAESLPGGQFPMRVESERVWGAVMPDGPADLPPFHLRNVPMARLVPSSADPAVARLRHQRGWNRFVSPPIVALADPRAAREYQWLPGANRELDGCHACERPPSLAEGLEIYSAGRLFSIRPESGVFAATPYAFLGEQARLAVRVPTVPADTVRAAAVQVAGIDPPAAEGAIQETVFVHSGEMSTGAVDLATGGRGGVGLVVDRTYASRTYGLTPFGFGWASSLFEHLRELPGGDVEYRDGAGETWTFTRDLATGGYLPPRGLFLALTREERGWRLLDQQSSATWFDALGRLTGRADRFADPTKAAGDDGNRVHFLYDDRGRLLHIVDPLGRRTTVRYTAEDLVGEMEDWRGRKVTYAYDAGRLVAVDGPETRGEDGFAGRPRTRYTYQPRGGTFTERVDFAANLTSIADPGAQTARVTFDYDLSADPPKRDRVTKQTWATGETASFFVTAAGGSLPTQVSITDALGQQRFYELTGLTSGRRQVRLLSVADVPVLERLGAVTAAALDDAPEPRTLHTEVLERSAEGRPVRVRLPHGVEVVTRVAAADGGAAGTRVMEVIQEAGPETLATLVDYDTAAGAKNLPLRIGRRDGASAPAYRDAGSPSRTQREVRTADDDVVSVALYDNGQLTRQAQKDPNGNAETNVEQFEYYDASAPLLARGRVKSVRRPGDGGTLLFGYAAAPAGGDRVVIEDALRGTVTTIERDSAGRPIRQTIAKNGVALTEERFGYDANGQLVFSARRQDGLGEVVTRTKYDAMLRPVEISTTHASVAGEPSTLVATTTWDLANRTITRSDPHVDGSSFAREITTLDGLGRVAEVRRLAASGPQQTLRVIGYDRQGLLSYESDRTRAAVLRVHDPFGRESESIDSMGQRRESRWTVWNEFLTERQLDAAATPNVVAQRQRVFTTGGRVRAINEELVAGAQFRSTRFGWSGGGSKTDVRVGAVAGLDTAIAADASVRLIETRFDTAGRMIEETVGEGRGFSASFVEHGVYQRTELADYSGALPGREIVHEPRAGAAFTTRTLYDGLGRPLTTIAPGDYTLERTFDQAGNVRSSSASGHAAPSAATYDSRGLVLEQTHPDGPKIGYRYDALGNLIEYRDEEGQVTTYETDGLGRVVKARYPDGTCEATVFENGSGLAVATRDRAGQWLVHRHRGYLVESIHAGPLGSPADCSAPVPVSAPAAGEMLVRYTYDLANRLTLVASPHAAVEWTDFDLAGRPHTTRAIRYSNGTGLTAAEVLDVHTQKHEWSVFDGERERYRMPVPGTSVAPASTHPRWRSWIDEQHDAVGNLIAQTDGATILSRASARGIGRLALRERPPIQTLYGYAEPAATPTAPDLPPAPPAPAPHSGLLGRAELSVGNATLAGSVITRDLARRIGATELLGLRDRESLYTYDERDRLTHALLAGVTGTTTPTVTETLTPADFRSRRNVTRLSAADREALGPATARHLELPSFTATPGAAHQIDAVSFDDLRETHDFVFTGGRRTRDGVWNLRYDAHGRLVQLTRIHPQADAPNRYEYDYDPLNRLVGRRACSNTDGGPCVLETRTTALARDALPAAHTTFVWDPITDRLAAIFETGRSTTPAPDEYAGLLRQYIHGDRAYDDPILVVTPDATYHPVIDEAGTGNVIAVLNEDGTLAERVLYGDAYGAEPRYLHGPVVQRITRKVTRNGTGEISEVVFGVELSDPIRPDTVAAGTRLRAIRADGSVALSSALSPALDPAAPHIVRWTLNAAQWTALSTAPGAEAIEIAVTDELRASGWGEAPVVRIPQALRPLLGLQSSATEPVIRREATNDPPRLSDDESSLADIADLYVMGRAESKTEGTSGFKAGPFIEPSTGLAFFRNRWYDPSTGTWLTPDRESYAAGSSNLYAGFNGDPVNNIDPDGNEPITGAAVLAYLGNVALQTGIDVGIDWAWNAGANWWNGTNTDFDWHDSLQTNFSINLVSGGVGGKLKHLAKLRNPILRKAATEGAEYAVDVAATGTVDMVLHDQSAAEAYGTAAIGGAIGRSAPMLLRGARKGYRRVADAYNNSIFSSEVGAIGYGVRNMPKSRATALRTLSPLTGSYADAFEGPVRERTFRAGERVFRSPKSGEIETLPGPWFGTRRTRTRVGTESQSNIVKWGNPVDRLWEYEFTQDVTVYYGRVAGGTGYQLLFPRHINPAAVLKYLGEDVLR